MSHWAVYAEDAAHMGTKIAMQRYLTRCIWLITENSLRAALHAKVGNDFLTSAL